MEWLFRRHFWIVQLAFLALAAIILAVATNMLVEHLLIAESTTAEKRSAFAPAKSVIRDFEIINERNLFQARREKPELIDETVGNCDEYWLSDKTSANVNLVGTIIFDDPTQSIAMIDDKKQAGAKEYSINECGGSSSSDLSSFGSSKEPAPSATPQVCNNISGVGEIKRIDRECVYFYNPSSRHCEYVSLFNAKCKLGADEIPKAATPTPVTTSPTGPDELGKSIKTVGPGSYEIDRTDLDNILGNLNQLLAQARVVPETVDGKPGWRFTMIQQNSVIAKIGFQVGDVITKINGYEPEAQKLGDLFARLKTDSQFNVDGKRGSGSFTLEYNVKR